MTTLARSAESLAVPEIVPVADARMPTYTVEARNSRFMAGSMMSTSKGLVVVAPGVTGPLTLNHGVGIHRGLQAVEIHRECHAAGAAGVHEINRADEPNGVHHGRAAEAERPNGLHRNGVRH